MTERYRSGDRGNVTTFATLPPFTHPPYTLIPSLPRPVPHCLAMYELAHTGNLFVPARLLEAEAM